MGTGGPLGMEHFPAPPNTGNTSLQTQGTPGPQSLTPHSAWPAEGDQGGASCLPVNPCPVKTEGGRRVPDVHTAAVRWGRTHRQTGPQPAGRAGSDKPLLTSLQSLRWGLRFLSETLSLAFEMLMSEKKKKSKDVFILRGIHRTLEPTEIHLPTPGEYTEPQSPRKPTCHPRVRACSLQNTAPLETRGPAQREISHSGGTKGTCCYGNAPQVSPEAQEEKALGGHEHRETPSKEARGHGGGHGREPSVRTALSPTPGCSPDTPSTSCRSYSREDRPLPWVSPCGWPSRLPSARPPPWEASSRRRCSSTVTVRSPSTDEGEALLSQERLFASVVA